MLHNSGALSYNEPRFNSHTWRRIMSEETMSIIVAVLFVVVLALLRNNLGGG